LLSFGRKNTGKRIYLERINSKRGTCSFLGGKNWKKGLFRKDQLEKRNLLSFGREKPEKRKFDVNS